MKIFNIRLGFATNSSSSHSIILVKNPENYSSSGTDRDGYGWDNFTLKHKDEKLHYFASQLVSALGYGEEPTEEQKLLLKEITGYSYDEVKNSYVDHQSVWHTSLNINEKENLKNKADFLSNPNVIILGGNDNSDGHPDYDANLETDIGSVKIKKDGDYTIWFNKENGSKIRFSENQNALEYTKSNTPELVDVKLTDYCSFGCSECYQGSTTKGKHGLTKDIKKVIDALATMQTFEIAFGGGEPTQHPDFLEIINYCFTKGIIPNFTTRNIDFLLDEKNTLTLSQCGGIACSITDSKELDDLNNKIEKAIEKNYNLWRVKEKINIQHVVGTCSYEELKQLLLKSASYGFRVTLLSFKDDNRGIKFRKNKKLNVNIPVYDDNSWIKAIKESIECISDLQKLKEYGIEIPYDTTIKIGIDTQLAERGNQQLQKELNVAKELFTLEEGKFSCYFDCVENELAKSSYGNIVKTKLEPESEDFYDQFLDLYKNY